MAITAKASREQAAADRGTRDGLINEAYEAGMTLTEIAKIALLSTTHVSQIIAFQRHEQARETS